MTKSSAGKGDSRRPENAKKFRDGYERIFGKRCGHPGYQCHVSHPCEECGQQSEDK